MAVFRAGPWGTPSDPYQPRPDVVSGRRDFDEPDIGVYPINVANNAFGWSSFYSAKQQVCARPTTLTAESFFGVKTLEQTAPEDCSAEYYWSNPAGPLYGELRIKLTSINGVWNYTQTISGAGFGVNTSLPIGVDQTQEEYIIDPTGLYDQDGGPYSYNVTTPQ